MNQSEINEISVSFLEAWEEYFGAEMYLIPYTYKDSSNVYGDKKTKTYDLSKAILFHGTLKELESQDVVKPDGRFENKFFDVTLVTKELNDNGVYVIDTNSIIKYIDNQRNEFYFKIYDTYQKVQFNKSKIFTKIRVTLHECYPS